MMFVFFHFYIDFSFFQTIKCLLIVPNPESALNEEAGRLLLEKYDDYAKHAKLMTMIHASPKRPEELKTAKKTNSDVQTTTTLTTMTTSSTSLKTSPKKRINTKENQTSKTTDKKKSLKRL